MKRENHATNGPAATGSDQERAEQELNRLLDTARCRRPRPILLRARLMRDYVPEGAGAGTWEGCPMPGNRTRCAPPRWCWRWPPALLFRPSGTAV